MAILQQKIGAIPYWYMTTEPGNLWELCMNKYPTVSTMILSGPSIRAEKLQNVQLAQAMGINVLGYVHTSYAARSIAAVKADIDTHFSYYGVQGIFLDEAANTSNPSDIAYYATLYQYIKNKPSGPRIVTLNPGATTKEEYAQYADHIMVAETRPSSYRNRRNPDWETRYPASLFWHAIHSCPASEVNEMITLSRQRNCGLLYITDDLNPPNPYNTLPTYWDSFVLAVEAANAGSVDPLTIEEGGGGGGDGGSSGSGGGGSADASGSGIGPVLVGTGGFFAGDRNSVPSTRRKGYHWKLCAFSTEYYERFTTTEFFAGNSTGLNHNATGDTIPAPAIHPGTDGGMNYKNNGGTPGWVCLNDSCPYYIANGKRYFEY